MGPAAVSAGPPRILAYHEAQARDSYSMTTTGRSCIGVLDLNPAGHGYLREPKRHHRADKGDVFVGSDLIDRHQLRAGLRITGSLDGQGVNGAPRLAAVAEIEGKRASEYTAARGFDELTPVDPAKRITLEVDSEPLSLRVIDLFTPVGKGQRGLIVAPPRTGKTILLQQIANAVARNHPEIQVMVLLVDERPEEVTEVRRSLQAELFASSNDHDTEEHIRTAELAIDRAKRVAERGGDALVLLDSLTRLARAYNKGSSSGRTMTGGVDIKALDVPKRLFGAARAFEEGGSLTVLASCLIETGSRMDDLIFQEFKGTGNMELVLDRKLAERRLWPAIDLLQSGTRKEELLLDPETLRGVSALRRTLADMKTAEAMESLTRQLAKFPNNAAFLERIGQALK